MKGIIAWFCRNGVAANLLMCGILSMGIALLLGSFPVKPSENPKFHKFQQDIAGFLGSMPTEVFPDFELDILEIGVEYRGATPAEVEESIVVKIEEAIQDLEGIKKISSSSAEGAGAVTVEVESDYEVREMLDDVKNRVDAISTFPDLAEKPIVRVAQRSSAVITVVLSAEMDEAALRTLGELTRDEIANLPKITQVSLGAVRPYEIGIEVSEETLQRYGLTLAAVARAVSQTSIDLPAGSIKTRAGEILLRTKGQAYVQEDFEKIVLLTREDGTRLTLGEIANVRDGFEEEPLFATFNGKPCVLINVARVGDQNAIELAQIVKDYMDQKRASLPSGVSIDYWNDRSRIVAGRLDTLLKSAWWGMWFVILVLALFLRPSVAIWVFLGIPISFAGAIMLMPLIGVSFNIFSLFAFILVLGIVVDDAIVTGENVFTHLENAPAGTDGTDAAIKGTQEVAVPVVFGILTTVVAFVPLLMIEGTRGKIFAQISLVIIPVLLFSLVESKLILPAHLKHLATGRKKASELNFLYRFQRLFADGLEMFVLKVYRPTLAVASAHRYITLSLFIGTATIIFALVASTRVQFVYFPRVESETATATLTMPLGTPSEATQRYVTLIREKAEALQEKYTDADGNSAVLNIMAVTGGQGQTRGGGPRGSSASSGQSHAGEISLRMSPPETRNIDIGSRDLVNEWRESIGSIPGAKELNFRAEIGRGGSPIDVQLAGPSFDDMAEAATKIKAQLATYAGVFDITDTYQDGKEEVKLKIKPEAEMLGLTMTSLAQQTRQAFFGQEAQRIQRGREEIRIMVRYPKNERESLANLESMRVRTPNNTEVPFSAVADAEMGRSFSTIRRVDRNRTISISGDADKEAVNMTQIEGDLSEFLAGLVPQYPGMTYTFEGESRERADSFGSLKVGGFFVFFVLYVLLAIPFRSYVQPLIVMSVIPFGLVGAIVGHMIMGMPLSIMSIFGMLALSGVVVNDSLVLVDFINRRREEGVELVEAVRIAGVRRFRAIILTSMTTFVGLMPLLFEKSTQAQFLIPMAISLGFGILFATLITLFLVPINYLVLEDIRRGFGYIWNWQPEAASAPKPSKV